MRDYRKDARRGEGIKCEHICYFRFLYQGSPGTNVRSIIAELRGAENGLNVKIYAICDFGITGV